MQISFQLFMFGEPRSKHALIQKRPEIKQKKTSLITLHLKF